jgi:hypothetical protein
MESLPLEGIAMRRLSCLSLAWPVLFALVLGAVHGAAAGESESDKRQQFLKAYSSTSKEERRKAVQSLAGCGERATLDLLVRVVTTDKEKEVRLAAYGVLAARPETDPGVTAVLLQCFRAEGDTETKCEMVRALRDRKFRFEVIGELLGFLATKCSYPDIPETASQFSPTGNSYAKYEKQREARGRFHDVVLTINALSGQSFTSSKKTVDEIRAWWAAHGSEIQKADRDLEKELRGAAEAKKATGTP